ncbi:MAG: helix-turn-helix domain-containing protein [Nanoarchaeota archaeon]|nr:helix-turn-helix domain-containing protein [Nanoarchaeota archaeon]
MPTVSRITIVSIRRPAERTINQELQWLGSSLGLFGERDRNRSCFRVFIELLKSARLQKPLSSDELADMLGLTRGTVVHHLHHLTGAGIVIREQNKYLLRVDTLSELVDEVEKDVLRTLHGLRDVANQIDTKLR